MYLVFDSEILNSCDAWPGARDGGGYGMRRVSGVVRRVHILEWEKHNGPVPTGMVVMHSCDNPPCRNIAHLSIGTRADNNKDRTAKGRSADMRGERSTSAALSQTDVDVIRGALLGAPHGTARQLARRYGVSDSTISLIKRGRRYVVSCI